MLVLCYGLWSLATTAIYDLAPGLAVLLAALATAFHASLTHEVVHGHPFPGHPRLNAALVAPALTLIIPYGRFRDTHLAHHNDSILTDPYDDPESNYLAPEVWDALHQPTRWLLTLNNTLAGRMILGPAIGVFVFLRQDIRLIRAGDRQVLRDWILHVPALGLVAGWFLWVAAMPFWAFAIAAYLAMSILKIRTFLEHQAHERASGRTVIIEDRGPLAWMFLNNNLHVVHHMHPKVPWYRLWRLYSENASHYHRRNGGYVYRSYAEVFRAHFLRRKDPVPHPFWHKS
jgi:fatty acid desaturase